MNIQPKILIVENQADVLFTISHLLKNAGCQIVTARTGFDAIQRVRQEEFDLVTLEIGLPDSSGLDICRYLKQDFRFNRTPVIFVTAQHGEKNRQNVFEHGAADFIEKPFDGSSFVKKILSHLKIPQSKVK